MGKQKNVQVTIIAVLAVAVLIMSVGFAASAYTRDLTVSSGTFQVQASKWDVHFDTESYVETTGSVAATSKSLTGTSMTYDVTLSNVGDFYEFTVDVENLGSFDANLIGITMSSLSTEQSKYLTYAIEYDGVTYTATQNNLTNLTLVKKTGVESVKVRVEYVQPTNAADLPSTDQTVSLTASLSYVQVQ